MILQKIKTKSNIPFLRALSRIHVSLCPEKDNFPVLIEPVTSRFFQTMKMRGSKTGLMKLATLRQIAIMLQIANLLRAIADNVYP